MEYKNNIQTAREKYLTGQILSEEEQKLIDKDLQGKDYIYFQSEKKPFILPEKYIAEETYKIIEQRISPNNNTVEHKSPRAYIRYIKYVAAVAVLAVISTLVFKYMSSPADMIYVSTSYGERKEIRLPDGSTVMLNSLSKLSYPEKMNGGAREVQLKGEGYFDVAKDAEKTFIVKAENLNIKVLGTKFNVEAYENEESITTTLFEGSVSVNLDNGYTDKLEPGQQAVFRKNENKVSIRESTTGVDEKVSWQKGIFAFDRAPLSEILKTLDREYNKDFKLTNQELENLRITVRFDTKEPVETILEVLGESADFNFRMEGNTYIIKSN